MIHDKVIQYCKKQNISVCAFEKMCGLSNGTVGGWAKGSPGNPSVDTLKKIVSITKIDYSYWLDND